ncbi:MAG TPA: hypothetical protein DCZ94_12230 [Lentisphaeria bacterium]|nr:MAG: hypothetical protein A2X48_12635 [Lentisphaerae bacterium GWF2_49_21]HBC87717.1 hypothetical protein [Lentisphaeria bacterium]
MKTKACLFVTAVLLFAATPASFAQKGEGGAQNITTTINTARYILFGGSYTVNGERPGENRESAVFKLDTYTGKVWMLKVDKAGNGRAVQWILIEDADNIVADKEARKDENGQKPGMKSLRTLDE